MINHTLGAAMGNGRVRALITAILLVVLAACAGGGAAGDSGATATPGTGSATSKGSPTLTVPSSPGGEVTDVRGVALNPGADPRVGRAMQGSGRGSGHGGQLELHTRDLTTPCTPRDHYCLLAGVIAGTSIGVIRVVDKSVRAKAARRVPRPDVAASARRWLSWNGSSLRRVPRRSPRLEAPGPSVGPPGTSASIPRRRPRRRPRRPHLRRLHRRRRPDGSP